MSTILSTELFTGLIGFLGICLGAVLQFFFGKLSKSDDQRRMQMTEAYVEFVVATGALAIAQNQGGGAQDLRNAMARIANAKVRIAIYGDASVTKALAEFFRVHGKLDNPIAMRSFAQAIEKMRKSSGHSMSGLTFADLTQLAFSVDLDDPNRTTG